MYESPGGPRPPAADAHACSSRLALHNIFRTWDEEIYPCKENILSIASLPDDYDDYDIDGVDDFETDLAVLIDDPLGPNLYIQSR